MADEVVEELRGDDHRPRDHDAHVFVLVVLAVFHKHRVHKRQAAGLAAERTLADAREGHGVGVGLGVETRHDALPEQRAVVADESYQHAAVFFDRREVALVILADRRCQREQSPRVEPFREVILRGVVFERPVGDRGDHLLHLRQVLRAADLGARVWVLENEVAEGELFGDVVVQLREQRLGVLGDESRTQLRGLFAESHLRRLQQYGHQRVILPDAAAEVDAGVEFLALGRVVAAEYEPHVGDHAQQVFLVTGIIIALALVLMGLILLNFQEFIEDTTAAKLSVLFAPDRIWVPLVVVLVLFIVGGILPGRLFARIPVSQVFRRYTEGKKGWKRPLLFVQFAGVAFICGLMYVVMAQYNYVKDKDMGYNPQRVAIGNVYFGGEEASGPALQFFRGLPYVEEVSSAVSTPVWSYSGSMIEGEGGQSLFSTRFSYALEDYFKMMGMTMKEGRPARASDEIVVNEAFAERMRWGDKALNHPLRAEGRNLKVVGVLKNFHIGSFYQPQDVIMFGYTRTFGNTVHVRLKEPFAENLRRLNKDVSEAYPDKTVDFYSMEDQILNKYNPVRVFSNATILAALTMFFVMLMGLIGYTTDEVRRRSKEIAIRKVNGAESLGILELLSKDVLYVAAPAVIIGIISAAYINGMWMDQFAEQVPLSWPVYILIALVILLLILACVIWKSWRIANENPVNSIKSE